MKGDFSRTTFNRKKHYSSVRMQQGPGNSVFQGSRLTGEPSPSYFGENIELVRHIG